MRRGLTQSQNHPSKGASIRVEPIIKLEAIQRIKQNLAAKPRDLCLFTLGINTAYRASELLALTIGQVAHLKPKDILVIKQTKNNKYRKTNVNEVVYRAIQDWLAVYPDAKPQAPLFSSMNTGEALCVSTVNRLVKQWCREAGLVGNFGSHTLRKTWGYHQRKTFEKPTALLTRAYGHASEWQTLEYLCIQPEEIEELYAEAL